MLQKVKITAVFRGKQIVKKGTPEEKEIDKIAIKTETHGDVWLSSFKTRGTEGFIEGMDVELDITQNGQYYNFNLPSALEKRVMALEAVVFPNAVQAPALTVAPVQTPPPADDISPEDIPF